MSLCRLMVLDYSEHIGRIDEDLPGVEPAQRYSDGDLDFGAAYAAGLIEEGYVTEPFLGFNLAGFAFWCCQQLGEV